MGRGGGRAGGRHASANRAPLVELLDPGGTLRLITWRRPPSRAWRPLAAVAVVGPRRRRRDLECFGGRGAGSAHGARLVLFDGSGAALPPIDADATVVVVGPAGSGRGKDG
jgi:hypothetical protein